jgi:hypothetical protein
MIVQVEQGERPLASAHFLAVAKAVPGWTWPPVEPSSRALQEMTVAAASALAAPPAAARPPLADATEDVKAIVVETLRVLRGRMADCPPSEIRHLANSIATQGKLLASVTGQTEITWPALVRSRVWREILELLTKTLEPYPEAVAAVAAAFEEYGAR